MKGKHILLGLVMAALVFSCAGWPGQKSPEKPAVKPLKPLIRKDLLQKKAGRMTAPGRDLFSPRMTAGTEGLPLVMPQLKTSLPPQEARSGESQAPSLMLHYIGYSYNKTKQKFVALVFFEEQVTAVQEGDVLPTGWKVLKITAKELEIEGPDKKIQTFSIEGEQR
jgi:hypothetical protein